MATDSLPLKVRFKRPRPPPPPPPPPPPSSSPRTITQQDILRSQADNLISADSTHILALLNHLYAPTEESFEEFRKKANVLLDLALEQYPTAIVVTLTAHLQNSADGTVRLRCAKLLHCLFRPSKNLYNRISIFFRSKIKAVLFQRSIEETYPDAFEELICVVSNIAEVLLPKKEWPELYDFIFESMKSNEPRKKLCAFILSAELIPKCPQVFLFHIDVLSDAFKGFMSRTQEDRLSGWAAVTAAVQLILHLAAPSNHEKHYDLLHYMGRALLDAVDESRDHLAQHIIKDMMVLAQDETRFLNPHIGFLVKTMLDVAESYFHVDDMTRKSAVEFVVKVAEDMEYGCGMIQSLSPELLKRLFNILLTMLSTVGEDNSWDDFNSLSEDEDEFSTGSCSYAMEAIARLVKVLGENVIMRNLPDCFPQFLEDSNWQSRHAAITALGLIADGCPKACSGISMKFVQIIVNLCIDIHPEVCYATIQAIGQFSKNWEPGFQGELYSYFLPGLVGFMEDFHNPELQLAATSTVMLFSKKCGSEIFSRHFLGIFRCLCSFLQKGLFKAEALAALASLADTFQEEIGEYYDFVLRYAKVFLAVKHKKKNSMIPAKALECMTTIAVAVGKDRFIPYVDRVIDMLINFQDCLLDWDDPMRYHILQAWARLGKCLGTDFVPYLSVSMRQLLASADLMNFPNSDDESFLRNVVEEKAIACEVFCSFATEFISEIHAWIDEMLFCLIPLLTFKHDARVRTNAISAMPLMLHAASYSVDMSLPICKSIREISNRIIPALIDALCQEMESGVQLKLLEALKKCFEIMGSRVDKSVIYDFTKAIAEILSTYSNVKRERRRRVEKGLEERENSLLQAEIETEYNIYRAIGDCLSIAFKIFRTSFLPMFDKLLPCLVLQWNTNSTEQKIFLYILRNAAKECGEDAFKYHEAYLLSTLKSCNLDNPSVWQLLGYGISICAEFGGNVFKPHREAAVCALQCILSHPKALHPDYVVNSEIAVFALGKMCKFQFNGPQAHMGVKIWLSYLPLRNNLVEAQETHDDLCTMVEKSEDKVLGPRPQYSDYKTVIYIFAQILLWGNTLATEETSNRIKMILRKFKKRLLSCDFESICSSFPFPLRTILNSCLSF